MGSWEVSSCKAVRVRLFFFVFSSSWKKSLLIPNANVRPFSVCFPLLYSYPGLNLTWAPLQHRCALSYPLASCAKSSICIQDRAWWLQCSSCGSYWVTVVSIGRGICNGSDICVNLLKQLHILPIDRFLQSAILHVWNPVVRDRHQHSVSYVIVILSALAAVALIDRYARACPLNMSFINFSKCCTPTPMLTRYHRIIDSRIKQNLN